MKMQDLVKTDRIYNSKKNDSISPDDEDVAEPLTGSGASASSPTATDTDDGVISPRVVNPLPTPSPTAAVNIPPEQLLLASTGQPLLRIPAVGLMFADTLYGAPTLLPELVNRWGAVHKILIILTIRQVMLCSIYLQSSDSALQYLCLHCLSLIYQLPPWQT